jgi:hypothetical protein
VESGDKSARCRQLDPERIIATVDRLHRRIGERFPDAGLRGVAERLLEVSEQAKERSDWFSKPIVWLRILTATIIALILFGLGISVVAFEHDDVRTFAEFVPMLESAINDIILIAMAIFFLISLESRIKRTRALAAIHELRTIAHVIDMHQLTKDPERLLLKGRETASSPRPKMTVFELTRYLDYCSELLSLNGKIAALYIQNFDDSVALASVTEVENLSNDLSRKIWQKLMILNSMDLPADCPLMEPLEMD